MDLPDRLRRNPLNVRSLRTRMSSFLSKTPIPPCRRRCGWWTMRTGRRRWPVWRTSGGWASITLTNSYPSYTTSPSNYWAKSRTSAHRSPASPLCVSPICTPILGRPWTRWAETRLYTINIPFRHLSFIIEESLSRNCLIVRSGYVDIVVIKQENLVYCEVMFEW